MRYKGLKCGSTRTCQLPCEGNCRMLRAPPSCPGHKGQGSRGVSTDSEWPTTTQLRVIGSLRSSMRSIRLVNRMPRVYTPGHTSEQAGRPGLGHANAYESTSE